MTRFFLSHRNLLRLNRSGYVSTPDFPLTAETSHHFKRLTGYFLSFSSIPLQFGFFASISFLFAYFFSLITVFCFNRPPISRQCGSKIRFLTIAFELFFLASILISLSAILGLFPNFPNYSELSQNFVREINATINGMLSGIKTISDYSVIVGESFELYDRAFSEGKRMSDRLGLHSNSNIFESVRSTFANAETLRDSISLLAHSLNLTSLYTLYIHPGLPENLHCSEDCLLRLKNYNRNDVFEQQLNKIFECVDQSGFHRNDCLEKFEEATIQFLDYWVTPLDLHNRLVEESSNWQDIGAPKLYSLIEFIRLFYAYFWFGISSKV
jgi:hypothetical protein